VSESPESHKLGFTFRLPKSRCEIAHSGRTEKPRTSRSNMGDINLRRNLDLIRKLVLAVEDLPTGMVLSGIKIDGHSPEEVSYHSYLAVDAGLIKGAKIQILDDESPSWKLLHLTSEGHDFADVSRSEVTWSALQIPCNPHEC
jgi:Hypothetical protein (DUF2513)